jgi:membrane protein DedA with SNARE-associated domain
MPALSHVAAQAAAKFGYGAVALAVGVESIGIPFPGETTLIATALYAGASHKMNIVLVVAAAAIGAIIGDNIGFWIGREFGLRLLLRYGRYIRMTEPRIKLGQYLFMKHGGKVVFFGRFVAVLRSLAAFLAGANRMSWPRFLLFNALGAIVWSSAYGFGAYFLGKGIHRLIGPAGIVLGIIALIAIIAGVIFLRRNEKRLEKEAERALPGPVKAERH